MLTSPIDPAGPAPAATVKSRIPAPSALGVQFDSASINPLDRITLSPQARQVTLPLSESGIDVTVAAGASPPSLFEAAGNVLSKVLHDLSHDLRHLLKSFGFNEDLAKEVARDFVRPVIDAFKEGANFVANLTIAAAREITVQTENGIAQSFALVAKSVDIEVNHTTGEISISVASVAIESSTAIAFGPGQTQIPRIDSLLEDGLFDDDVFEDFFDDDLFGESGEAGELGDIDEDAIIADLDDDIAPALNSATVAQIIGAGPPVPAPAPARAPAMAADTRGGIGARAGSPLATVAPPTPGTVVETVGETAGETAGETGGKSPVEFQARKIAAQLVANFRTTFNIHSITTSRNGIGELLTRLTFDAMIAFEAEIAAAGPTGTGASDIDVSV